MNADRFWLPTSGLPRLRLTLAGGPRHLRRFAIEVVAAHEGAGAAWEGGELLQDRCAHRLADAGLRATPGGVQVGAQGADLPRWEHADLGHQVAACAGARPATAAAEADIQEAV